jgi:hypothetical protein
MGPTTACPKTFPDKLTLYQEVTDIRRRAIRAHNHRMRARAIRKQRDEA